MKSFITNRRGQRLCIVVEGSKTPGRLAFVMHGLGGSKDELQIKAIREAFVESAYTAVAFDTAHSFGESDGDYQYASVTNYYTDLQDVISWAAAQNWYREPFVLAGHSLGGICSALFAEKYPQKVQALAPIATVVSGALSIESHRLSPRDENIEQWQRDGVWVTPAKAGRPERRLLWSHMEDRLKYDLVPQAAALIMPVLLVVGTEDATTPLAHQKILFDCLPGPKQLEVIAGAGHTFRQPPKWGELKEIVLRWISTLG